MRVNITNALKKMKIKIVLKVEKKKVLQLNYQEKIKKKKLLKMLDLL